MAGRVRPITLVGTPVLHRRMPAGRGLRRRAEQLVDDMFASKCTAEGVGLAANQIGVDLKVFVYDCPDDDGERHEGRGRAIPCWSCPPENRRLDDGERGLSVRAGPRTPRWPAPTTPTCPARTRRASRSTCGARATSPAASSTRRTTSRLALHRPALRPCPQEGPAGVRGPPRGIQRGIRLGVRLGYRLTRPGHRAGEMRRSYSSRTRANSPVGISQACPGSHRCSRRTVCTSSRRWQTFPVCSQPGRAARTTSRW